MQKQKIWGIVFMVIGAIMFFFSEYIADQVAEGKLQIQQGKRTVKTIDSAFSQSKYTKPFGNVFTGGAKEKIRRGEREVSKYERISHNLKISGIIVFLIGIALFVFTKKKRG